MALTYFKRYDMEYELAAPIRVPPLPSGYLWLPWHQSLLAAHAQTKYRSFRNEIDASVFPCLGHPDGCHRLMSDIIRKPGFLPSATWLIAWRPEPEQPLEYCGTIQGICDIRGTGSVQNVGVVPEHRGLGLGRQLILKALDGFQTAGLRRVSLQVTARNEPAVRLYERTGFRRARVQYKVVQMAYCSQ